MFLINLNLLPPLFFVTMYLSRLHTFMINERPADFSLKMKKIICKLKLGIEKNKRDTTQAALSMVDNVTTFTKATFFGGVAFGMVGADAATSSLVVGGSTFITGLNNKAEIWYEKVDRYAVETANNFFPGQRMLHQVPHAAAAEPAVEVDEDADNDDESVDEDADDDDESAEDDDDAPMQAIEIKEPVEIKEPKVVVKKEPKVVVKKEPQVAVKIEEETTEEIWQNLDTD